MNIRWRCTHVNGRIGAASTEGYKRKAAALKNLRIFTGIKLPANTKPGSLNAVLLPR